MALNDLFGPDLAGMRDHLKRFALQFGIEDMPAVHHLPNTRAALALMELARDRERLDAARVVAMRGYWCAGLNLERKNDLCTIAAQAGLATDEALAAVADRHYLSRVDELREEASRMGVTGIPTFFFGDGPPVVGCQPYDILARAAEAAGASPRSATAC